MPTRARRVLIAQKFAGLGGAQVSLVHHLKHLDRRRYEPHVLVARQGWLTVKLTELGVPWTVLDFGHWTNPLYLPKNLLLVWRVARYIRRHRIDLVHANEHWIAPLCYWAARFTRIPAICHFRTGLEDLTPRRIRKYLYARFDRVIAVAEVLGKALAQHLPDPRRVVVVRDGVESVVGPPRYHRRRGRCIVVNVGAIRKFKGQRTVLEAALPWLKASRRHYLVLVGGITEKAYGESIEQLVRCNALGRQVLLLGSREDVPRLLDLADALVAYSSLEGVPRVVMEAMLAGRPVIVSNTPGMEEVVADGEVGHIVDFDGGSNSLGRALDDLAANPARWQALGHRGHEVAERRYSTRAMSEAIQAVYNELLHGRPES